MNWLREPEIGTNRPYLIDSIKISITPKLIGASEIKALYLQNGLSAAQIAEKYGVSKSFVFAVIQQLGANTGKVDRFHPERAAQFQQSGYII